VRSGRRQSRRIRSLSGALRSIATPFDDEVAFSPPDLPGYGHFAIHRNRQPLISAVVPLW